MSLDLGVADKIKQLRRVGLRPPERLAQQILHAGSAAVGPLLALATETDLLHEAEPQCFAPIHALRLLGELEQAEMIEPLLRQFPIHVHYEDEQLPQLWANEAPQMIGRKGDRVVATLWAIVDDPAWHVEGRGAALSALTYVTLVAPEQREPVVAALRERLAQSDDRQFAAHLVGALGSLGVGAAYGEVMALFRQGRIDVDVMPPGAARQLLLSGGNAEKRFECVKHPLWERYDLHGPFPEEAEQEV